MLVHIEPIGTKGRGVIHFSGYLNVNLTNSFEVA